MSSKKTEIQGRFWLTKQDHNFIGKGRIELLEKIAEFGSIAKAAKAMKMSYKAAWDAIEAMNNLSPELLVMRVTGGKGGGGTQVTDYGRRLIVAFKALAVEHQEFLGHLNQRMENFEHFYQLMRNLNMFTSARNQFLGTITSIKQDSLHAEVVLQLKGNDQIVAMITTSSVKRLGLTEGREAYALIKAPQIILMPATAELEVSARNCLCGKVIHVTSGPVTAEVTLELPGGNTLKATVTQDAISDLRIQEGDQMCGIFKAGQVLLAVKK
jgi:molybdate transport system regulatory protein